MKTKDIRKIFKELETIERQVRSRHMTELFGTDPDRAQAFSIEAAGMLLDYSKSNIDPDTKRILIELATAAAVESRRDAMLSGASVNSTERRPALHTALRRSTDNPLLVDGVNIMPEIMATRQRSERIAEDILQGRAGPAPGEPFRHVINIGIGGSSLGPEMACRALAFAESTPEITFMSNVDGSEAVRVMRKFDPAKTAVIVVSKTFTTVETMTNARTIRDWISAQVGPDAVKSRLIAVTAEPRRALDFGISADSILSFGAFVGGRYSIWGPVGISLMIAIGPDRFAEFLAGAEAMDKHFATAELGRNMPVLLALTGIWHNLFCRYPTRAVIPYDQRLARLPAYLQQLEMESNGKSVDVDGSAVARPTSPVLWGETGTDGQHAFFQLLHQGTQIVPCEFLIAAQGEEPSLSHHHHLLMANCVAQSEALMTGRMQSMLNGQVPQGYASHRDCPGNKPSVTLAYPKLSARTLGSILALYEHRVFVEAVISNINCFDQWGVEFGKELAAEFASCFSERKRPEAASPSTGHLVDYLCRNGAT